MDFHKLTETITKTAKSILYNPAMADRSGRPCVILEPDDAFKTFEGPNNIIIAFKLLKEQRNIEDSFWVLNCWNDEIVSIENLKRFKDSLSVFPGLNVKGTCITSQSPFSREAVDFAVKSNIGLARISPTFLLSIDSSINDVIHRTSPLEIRNALCDHEFGNRRKRFYGITTEGKIEHLGSLENYVRIELLK
ncbi:MAG: hypothetical protein ACYC21_10160 [Eubacteriales bacterium]